MTPGVPWERPPRKDQREPDESVRPAEPGSEQRPAADPSESSEPTEGRRDTQAKPPLTPSGGAPPGRFAPPVPPPPGGRGKAALIIGIAALFAVFAVGGALFVLISDGDPPPPPPNGSGGGAPPPPPPPPPPDGPGGGGGGGELADVIVRTAGPYRLTDARQFPRFIRQGAADAYITTYQGSGGVQLFHVLAAFGSVGEAEQFQRTVAGNLTRTGFRVAAEFDRRGGGTLTILRNDSQGLEAALWTNSNGYFSIDGPTGRVSPLYRALPYG